MSDELAQIHSVLFDFDGTLGDSYPAIAASVNHVRAVHGLPPLAENEVRRHVGRGPVHLIQQTVPGADIDQVVALYRAHHPLVMRCGTRLLPGAVEAVNAAKWTGRRVAVCSNKPGSFTRDLLEYLGLACHMDLVLGPEDVALPKPAPDMLLAGLAKLDLAAGAALYVGDMVVDIETARAAGVRVWVVPTGSDDRATLERGRPDRLLAGLQELADMLIQSPRNTGPF
jgi:phosphoglycolate phosphatase